MVDLEVSGGVVGVILDARGRRPFTLPADAAGRLACLTRWNKALDIYPNF